jgi:hypothetical protein
MRKLIGLGVVAALLAVGTSVAQLPSAAPTDAIPRAAAARESVGAASRLLREVERRIDGATLIDRDPERAATLLADASDALDRAVAAGVDPDQLSRLRGRAARQLDALHVVTRLARIGVVADLGAALENVEATGMVAASDGSLWVTDAGRGRVLRIDPAKRRMEVVYRAGQVPAEGDAAPGEPWLMATAATDVVVIDRSRRAWRMDLAERIPRRMLLNGVEELSSRTTLLGALQHRPPLEIFTLYTVDGATGEVRKWTPPAVIPVNFPDPPELYLTREPDLDPRQARDLRVDVNVWLLADDTVTRVDFGVPRGQDEYSLDPPPDADARPDPEYVLLDGATVGDRDYLYVVDAAHHRIVAFQRADGAFVRQWVAPAGGPNEAILDNIQGLAVTSVADGPPVAFLLTPDRVVRVVLE